MIALTRIQQIILYDFSILDAIIILCFIIGFIIITIKVLKLLFPNKDKLFYSKIMRVLFAFVIIVAFIILLLYYH